MADTYAPTVSNILSDIFLYPEYLHLPRMFIADYSKTKKTEKNAPHIMLTRRLFSGGEVNIDQVRGSWYSFYYSNYILIC